MQAQQFPYPKRTGSARVKGIVWGICISPPIGGGGFPVNKPLILNNNLPEITILPVDTVKC